MSSALPEMAGAQAPSTARAPTAIAAYTVRIRFPPATGLGPACLRIASTGNRNTGPHTPWARCDSYGSTTPSRQRYRATVHTYPVGTAQARRPRAASRIPNPRNHRGLGDDQAVARGWAATTSSIWPLNVSALGL